MIWKEKVKMYQVGGGEAHKKQGQAKSVADAKLGWVPPQWPIPHLHTHIESRFLTDVVHTLLTFQPWPSLG